MFGLVILTLMYTHVHVILIQIRIFDLAERQGFKCIHKFDVAKEMDKQSSTPLKELLSGIPFVSYTDIVD